MLESRALILLSSFIDGGACKVDPLDFTALLYLRDQGYVEVSVTQGQVLAELTVCGREMVRHRCAPFV